MLVGLLQLCFVPVSAGYLADHFQVEVKRKITMGSTSTRKLQIRSEYECIHQCLRLEECCICSYNYLDKMCTLNTGICFETEPSEDFITAKSCPVVLGNVSPGMSSTSSSNGQDSRKAIDGSVNTWFTPVTEDNPFWEIDLVNVYPITLVKMFTTSSGGVYIDTVVRVGLSKSPDILCDDRPINKGNHALFDCKDQPQGQYVRFTKYGQSVTFDISEAYILVDKCLLG